MKHEPAIRVVYDSVYKDWWWNCRACGNYAPHPDRGLMWNQREAARTAYDHAGKCKVPVVIVESSE